jgi:hypothetical protein
MLNGLGLDYLFNEGDLSDKPKPRPGEREITTTTKLYANTTEVGTDVTHLARYLRKRGVTKLICRLDSYRLDAKTPDGNTVIIRVYFGPKPLKPEIPLSSHQIEWVNRALTGAAEHTALA